MSSSACGNSPHEAAEPASVSCRDTTHWSGSSAAGTTLPTSTTVPPLRTDAIATRPCGDADRLERDVRSPPVGQRQQSIADVVAARLDDVARAHLRRAGQPARAEVDGDDPLAARPHAGRRRPGAR